VDSRRPAGRAPPGPPARPLLLPRSQARDRRTRWPGHRDAIGQPHPRAREGLARERVCGRDAHVARIAPALAARRTGEAAVLRPDRGGGDGHLPARGAGGLPAGPRNSARRAERRPQGRRVRRLRPLRLQDGHGLRQDNRHGDGRRLEHPQQGERPQRRPVLRRRAGGGAERDHPRPLLRTRSGARRGQPLPHARSRAGASHGAVAAGPGHRHQLARLRAAIRHHRRRGQGGQARAGGADDGNHPHWREERHAARHAFPDARDAASAD